MELWDYEISMPMFWLAAIVIFVIIEGLTIGLTTIWFAAGAAASLAVSLFSLGVVWQVVVFFIVSGLLLAFTRKLFVKKLQTGTEKTNVDALIGREAVVVKAIKPFEPGLIKLSGQEWTAVCRDDDALLEEGAEVKVIGIEGVKAIVSPLKQQEEKDG